MSWWLKAAGVISALTVLDGVVSLCLRSAVERELKRFFPKLDVLYFALSEIAVGLTVMAFVLWYAA